MRPGVYVTRGAYHSPTYDEARLAGVVEVVSEARKRKPVDIAGREFVYTLDFNPLILTPERQGPGMRPLAAGMERVKRPEVWGQYFRNSPIELSRKDYELLDKAVTEWVRRNQ